MPRFPSSVTRSLARTADAPVLPAPLPMFFTVFLFADRTPLRPMSPVAARFGALLTTLRPSSGAAALARVLLVPLPFPCAVSHVTSSAARALPPSAAAGLGALPDPLPSLLAASALACALWLPVPRSGLPWRVPCPACWPPPPLPDHSPGVLLPPQLRQRDARGRTRGRRGANGPRPPLREGGLGGIRTLLPGTWTTPGSGTGLRPRVSRSSGLAAGLGRCCGWTWRTLRPSAVGRAP